MPLLAAGGAVRLLLPFFYALLGAGKLPSQAYPLETSGGDCQDIGRLHDRIGNVVLLGLVVLVRHEFGVITVLGLSILGQLLIALRDVVQLLGVLDVLVAVGGLGDVRLVGSLLVAALGFAFALPLLVVAVLAVAAAGRTLLFLTAGALVKLAGVSHRRNRTVVWELQLHGLFDGVEVE